MMIRVPFEARNTNTSFSFWIVDEQKYCLATGIHVLKVLSTNEIYMEK